MNGQGQADTVLTTDSENECVSLQGQGFQIDQIPPPPASPSDPAPVFNGAPTTSTSTTAVATPSVQSSGAMNGIRVTTMYTGLGESSGKAAYDLFSGPCQTFVANYQGSGQWSGSLPPTTVAAGQVVAIGTTTTLTSPLPGGVKAPGSHQAGIVRNDHVAIVSYHCG